MIEHHHKHRPPRLAERFLNWFCKDDLLEEVRGDLHEFYKQERKKHSRLVASLRYWYHVLNFVRPFAVKGFRQALGQLYLVGTYLRLALRSFRKSPLFHGINTIGLAVGIAACLHIALFVKKEQSFDTHFELSDQIYRVETDFLSATATRHLVASAPAHGPAFEREIAGVNGFTRLRHGDTGDPQLMEYGEKSFFENRLFYADSSFFSVFDFEMAVGDPEEVLKAPNSVVLTAETANKYFGNENPVGRTVTLDRTRRFNVTGVLEPINFNTHLNFDFLLSMTSYEPPSFGSMDMYGWSTFYTYLLLESSTDPSRVEQEMANVLVRNWREDANDAVHLSLKPLNAIYLDSPDDDQVLGFTSNGLYSKLLLAIGVFIFLNCAFNHVNITTAKAFGRGKEVGVRKVLGAWSSDLRSQFMLESVVYTLAAIVLAIPITLVFLEWMGQDLRLSGDAIWSNQPFVLMLLGVALVILVPASSVYMMVFMSKVSPSKVLRGTGIKRTTGSGLRRVLITAQISMAFLLLISSFAVIHQLDFVFKKDLGFSQDQVLMVELNGPDLMSGYEQLKTSLEASPFVAQVGAARLGMEGRHGSYRVFPLEGEPSEEGYQMSIYPVQFDFFETLDMNIMEGRSYSRAFPLDTTHQFIINETAKRQLGFEDPVGKRIMLNGQGGMYGTVVGVVEDFHFKSLAFGLDPIVIFLRENAVNFVYVKLRGDDLPKAIDAVASGWKSVNGDYPFDFQFLDERLNANYGLDKRFQSLINFFSVLIGLITGMGLFGMCAHSVKQRTKELTIRRVLGAKLIQISRLLSRDFAIMIVVAFVLTTPLAVYMIGGWLDGFAYRSPLPWVNYALVFGAMVLLMFGIVGVNALNVSHRNTIQNLRNE